MTVTDASLTKAHLGDYIAIGLGFRKHSDGSSPANPTRPGNFTSIGASTSEVISGAQESSGYYNTLSHKIVTSGSFTTDLANLTFDSGDCWSYWPTFATAKSSTDTMQVVTDSTTPTSTFTWTTTASYPANLASKWTVERTYEYSRTIFAKGYNYTTTIIKATEKETETTLSKPGSKWTSTHTDSPSDGSSLHVTTASHANITIPTCMLPLSVCQSYASWCSVLADDGIPPLTRPEVLIPFRSAAQPLNPFTSRILAQPASSSKQYLPSSTRDPMALSSSQGQKPSPLTSIPFETGPDRNSPPAHDSVPNGSVTKSADLHVPTAVSKVTPTPRTSPVISNTATVGTANDPSEKSPSTSIVEPTAIIPIVIEGGRSGPEKIPAAGLPGTTTEDPGHSISSDQHKTPGNPGHHAGSGIAYIIGEHDTAAPAGPLLTSQAPAPKATSSGNVHGVNNDGSPGALSTSFRTLATEMGGKFHAVIPSNGDGPIIGGLAVTANPAVPGGVLIGDHSIARGETTTIAGSAVVNGLHGVVVGASSTISSLSPGQTATIDGQIIVADASGELVVGGSSIARGDATTVDGNVISNEFNGIVVGTSYTISIPSPVPVAPTNAREANVVPTVLFTLLGQTQTYIATSGEPLIVDGKTLSPGNSATNIDGQTISVGSFGVVVDGSTIAYSTATDSIFEAPTTEIASGSKQTSDIAGSKTNAAEIFSSSATIKEIAYTDVSGHIHTAVEVDGEGGTAVVDNSVTLTVGGRGTILEAETLSLASTGLVLDGSTKGFTTAAVPSNPTRFISTLGISNSPSSANPVPTDIPSGAAQSVSSCTWHLSILLHCVAFLAVST
ncbi:MAG: hypothetical protein M1822_002790 [Bathelium mastoideum]|nr:MAG: hypothetical protein M1822_002790 [Bathelium mastoideum]